MKRWMIPLLAVCSLVLPVGCGKKTEVVNPETTAAVTAAETKAGDNTLEERDWDRIPTVMVDGVLYESTGYISSAIGCGNMDGKITSTVEGNESPTENDQSNFGAGYDYQRSSEGQIVVVMDGMKVIFRDPKHSFTSDMPEEVLNFNAEVLEVRNGSLLVSFISTPDIFMPPFTGQCEVRVNPHILKEEAKAGDTVRVWFDGLVQEIYPPILPNVYRVVKEEQEPAEPLVGMANPWTDHKTLDEAENAVGYNFALPKTPGYKVSVWRTLGDNMLEAIFTDANGEEAYRIRKGRGQEDVSGDYNTYPIVNDLNIDGIDIDMREDEDGVHRIIFHSNEFAYSFTSGTYVPAEEEAEAIVSEIISYNDDFKAEAYHQNEDGSWSYMGRNYHYRLMLTGTLPNAAADSFYVVLSEYDDITFEDAADFLLSSTSHPDEENRFVIANLGVYTPECEVESAKVVVSAVHAAPTEITVCFDQYDNTVQSELLTGEYFSLEKKDGDQWTEVEPVIENAAFTAVGIVLQKGGITRKTFAWEWLYGRQEPGQYRIRVQVVDNTVHEAVAEFTIPE